MSTTLVAFSRRQTVVWRRERRRHVSASVDRLCLFLSLGITYEFTSWQRRCGFYTAQRTRWHRNTSLCSVGQLVMFQHQLQMVSFQCLLVADMSAFSASFTKTFCLDHKCLYDASPKAIKCHKYFLKLWIFKRKITIAVPYTNHGYQLQ